MCIQEEVTESEFSGSASLGLNLSVTWNQQQGGSGEHTEDTESVVTQMTP